MRQDISRQGNSLMPPDLEGGTADRCPQCVPRNKLTWKLMHYYQFKHKIPVCHDRN